MQVHELGVSRPYLQFGLSRLQLRQTSIHVECNPTFDPDTCAALCSTRNHSPTLRSPLLHSLSEGLSDRIPSQVGHVE